MEAQYGQNNFSLIAVENPTVDSMFVSPTGSDASCCGSRDTPCGTLAFAMQTVLPGNSVYLLAGTFTGPANKNLQAFGKAITITADPLLPPWIRPVIDCQGSGRAFDFSSGETSSTVLKTIAIQNCAADNGGAIRFLASSPTVSNIVFVNNRQRSAVLSISTA